MKEIRLIGIIILALLLTACSKQDEQETPLTTEPPKLNVYVYLPDRPVATRADNGDVASIENTIKESKISTLQIWVFNHNTKELIAYYKPETAPDPTTSTSPVTYLLNVSEAFANASTKPNVDVFVLANVDGYDKSSTPDQFDVATVAYKFGPANILTKVPEEGLPMTGVLRNVSVGGSAPVFTLPNVKLTRTVSKLRFVLSREIAPEEIGDNPQNKPVKINSIKLNAEMIPTTAYLFLEGNGNKYHIGTGYNDAAFDFLNGTPLTDIAKNDDPMKYAYQTGTKAQDYEDLIANGLKEESVKPAELTQVGPFYLFESDKQLAGTITYQATEEEAKTATFTMSDAGDFSRNHTWTVYAYYGSTRLEVVSVYVSDWSDYNMSNRPIYNW